jgi:hypothetical protein
VKWISEWVNVEHLRALSEHTCSCVATAACFKVTGVAFRSLYSTASFTRVIEWLEAFVIVGLFAYFSILLFANLWKSSPWRGKLNAPVLA